MMRPVKIQLTEMVFFCGCLSDIICSCQHQEHLSVSDLFTPHKNTCFFSVVWKSVVNRSIRISVILFVYFQVLSRHYSQRKSA